MTHLTRIPIPTRDYPMSTPGPHTLGPGHLAAVLAALPLLKGDWELDTFDDCDGQQMFLISRSLDDRSYVLHGAGDTLRLGLVVDDAWQSLGLYSTMGDTMRAIAGDLATTRCEPD